MTTLAADFAADMLDSVTYYPVASTNSNGEDQPGTGVAYACRIERKVVRVLDQGGQNVSSTFQAFVITSTVLSGRGWVNDGIETRRILAIENYKDDVRTPYVVIYA